MPRKKIQLRTADIFLPRSLTDEFILDLQRILSEDGSFEANYQAACFLSKFTVIDKQNSADRRSRAIDKWLKTDSTNATTNKRLSTFHRSASLEVFPGVTAVDFLSRVRANVAHVLFVDPSFDLAHGGFSGGASTSKTRVHSHPAMKFLGKADVTRPVLPLFRDVIRGTRWADHIGNPGLDPRIVEGNVLFTVPKNSDIDRVACKEPDLNMFLQKSMGNQIRYLLRKRVGINLNDQRINGELARVGSVDGSLLTLDLSSASDSISTKLVELVVPPAWFEILDLIRSKVTIIDSVEYRPEMFSSMGNGFTFELESLIFYSIVRAVAYLRGVKGRLSVYGDDIIAPSELGQDLISALAFCGFSVNEDKSFIDGPFRESCGKHWYLGRDVSPFYLRRPFSTISDLILTLNQLTSWSSRVLGIVDPRYEALHLKYRKWIPESLWGGDDLTSRSSLVTGDSPRKELHWPTEVIPHNHVGGLLFWHFLALTRGDGSDSTTDASSLPRFARIRRRRSVNMYDLPIFLSKYDV